MKERVCWTVPSKDSNTFVLHHGANLAFTCVRRTEPHLQSIQVWNHPKSSYDLFCSCRCLQPVPSTAPQTPLPSVSFHSVYPSITFQVNLEYLETKLESVDGEEVQRIQDNINSLFHHCVQALGEEHQIKVVNALQASRDHEHCPFFFSKVIGYSTQKQSPMLQIIHDLLPRVIDLWALFLYVSILPMFPSHQKLLKYADETINLWVS